MGSHSATHSDLPSLDPLRLRREVVDSPRRSSASSAAGDRLLLPSGRNSATVRPAVKAAGYASA